MFGNWTKHTPTRICLFAYFIKQQPLPQHSQPNIPNFIESFQGLILKIVFFPIFLFTWTIIYFYLTSQKNKKGESQTILHSYE